MVVESPESYTSFFVTGINYKKADAGVRGRFSIDHNQYKNLLNCADDRARFFIVSTCNRTEIYGFATCPHALADFLCSATQGSLKSFAESSYTFQGIDAINHLFSVASGMDSQIVGDYEIVGQIKQAVKLSKEAGKMNAFLERLANEVFAASKAIRTNTAFSSGTVSVSFAAIQFIKKMNNLPDTKHILLIGTGKIGSITCKNIVDYLPGSTVTVVNRTNDKAAELARSHKVNFERFENLQHCISSSDVVIVATQADEVVISKSLLGGRYPALFIDLSVPCNIASDVQELPGTVLINVDALSKISDDTLELRKKEIPGVKAIIGRNVEAFLQWHQHRAQVPVLHLVKSHLQALSNECGRKMDTDNSKSIQKTINGLAMKMRENPTPGCHYLNALREYMDGSAN